VKANSLNHPDNGRIIVLDDKLKALLNPPEGIQITFLNIQKYLSPHYVKNDDEPKPLKRPSVRKVKA
jgi:upstream activation factor subunit UAF30